MDKEKADKILEMSYELMKLQEKFKEITGSTFAVSQNFIDIVNFAKGYVTALWQKEKEEREKAKEEK